jgi:hypothetical protein
VKAEFKYEMQQRAFMQRKPVLGAKIQGVFWDENSVSQ